MHADFKALSFSPLLKFQLVPNVLHMLSISVSPLYFQPPFRLTVIKANLSQGQDTSGHGITHRDSMQPTHSQLRWKIKEGLCARPQTDFDVLLNMLNGGASSVLHFCVVSAPTASI